MRRNTLNDFIGGWFIGSFTPTLFRTDQFEVAVKRYAAGDREANHHQRIATEVTVVVSGRCRLGPWILEPNDVVTIEPLEAADFEALDDVVLIAVKYPSLPDDKVLGDPHG